MDDFLPFTRAIKYYAKKINEVCGRYKEASRLLTNLSAGQKEKMGQKKIKQKKDKPAKSQVEMFVDFERRRYSREWDISSAHFSERGYYDWMADTLGILEGRILEIGCGAGESTLALAKRHRVVAVEENPACIRRARETLQKAGIHVIAQMRSELQTSNHIKIHKIAYAEVKQNIDTEHRVEILEGNIISDPRLYEFLLAAEPFDAVVCWLIGTHSALIYNKNADLDGITSPGGYRLLVQNRVYELADKLLKPGGVLQVVDRGQQANTQFLRDEVMRSHCEQASVTSLVPTHLDECTYEEPSSEGATEIIFTLPTEGSVESITGLSLSSVRSLKPSVAAK